MSRTLLDITDDLRAIDDLLAECDGDISDPQIMQAIEDWFSELDSNLLQKCDNYAAFITELQSRARTRKEEAERLANRAKIDENHAQFLKHRLLCAMQERGQKKIETNRYRISVANNGGKQPVDIHAPDRVPRDLCKHIPERYEPDVDVIRERLAKGEWVSGATLQDRGRHLRIK